MDIAHNFNLEANEMQPKATTNDSQLKQPQIFEFNF